jgi:flagella basal body P-ring formation protein FlgA
MLTRTRALALAGLLAAVTPLAAGERVLVPARVIYPGETITGAALKELELLQGRVPPADAATRIETLDGKVARRTLLPGRYINAAALRQPFLVDKGAAVVLTFTAGGLSISASAVSLEAGSPGDMVKVRNVDSGKVVSGTVMDDGTVQVSAR